jgi:uncharacterized membrane protein (UPF0127 family)
MTNFTIDNAAFYVKGKVCQDFFSRFLGLMFRKNLGINEGILIDQGSLSRVNSAIHMLFMRFDIAVIWLNNDFHIVDKVLGKKWYPFYIPKKPARYVLETHPDAINHFAIGEHLEIKYENL